MKLSKRYHMEERRKVIASFLAGVTLRVIANRYGVSREYIRLVLLDHGITGKSDRIYKRPVNSGGLKC